MYHDHLHTQTHTHTMILSRPCKCTHAKPPYILTNQEPVTPMGVCKKRELRPAWAPDQPPPFLNPKVATVRESLSAKRLLLPRGLSVARTLLKGSLDPIHLSNGGSSSMHRLVHIHTQSSPNASL